jgi:uncharacterized protein (DUF885 family)
MINRFDEMVRQILHGLWEEDPVEASFLGIHAYDSVLPRTDAGSRAAYHRQRSEFRGYLKEFPDRRAELDAGRRMDLDLLLSELEVSLYADKNFRLHERRADRYPSEALYGIYILAMRNFAPLEERLESIKDRLNDTPRFLAEGRENLRRGDDVPRVWTEVALDVARSADGFYREIIGNYAERVPGKRTELLDAADKAGAAMREYLDYLENDLLTRSTGSFAIGKEAFDYLLSRKHRLPFDALELQEIGEEMVRFTQVKLKEMAAQIDADVEWPEIVARLKSDHPGPDEVINTYRTSMQETKQFVARHDLVTMPPQEQLHVVETPAFERATVPYAAYVPAAPFEEVQEGFFWVTPINADAPAESREDQLQGHCTWGIPLTALHEGYPGHHLQLCRANMIESLVRRQFSTPVFIEGWALYCEEMMEEIGYISDPRQRLLRLKDQLWRACRVVIDVGLHCFGNSFGEAVDMLVDVAKLERENAFAEVRRYTQTPTQPMSYLIGKLEILSLREAVKAAEGASFSLKSFHDRLLSYGSIPIAMIKKEMLES